MLELVGVNIILREFSEENLHDEKYFKWLRDLDVVETINRIEYILPIKFSEVEKYVNNLWNSSHDAFFSIYTKDKNEFIGTQRVSEINWRTGTANLGILIGEREYWGKGIAKDSISVICDYCFNKLSLRRLVANTLATNIAMGKCFERLGFKLEGILREDSLIKGKYVDRNLYGLFKNEFKPFKG